MFNNCKNLGGITKLWHIIILELQKFIKTPSKITVLNAQEECYKYGWNKEIIKLSDKFEHAPNVGNLKIKK
jgi:hypothetical protein